MLNKIDTTKRIYITPYNDLARDFKIFLEKNKNIQITSFVDSLKKGDDIIHFKEIDNNSDFIIYIISPVYYKEIFNNLSISLNKSKIYFVFFYRTKYKIFQDIKFFNLFLKKHNLTLSLELYLYKNFYKRKLKEFKNKHLNQRAFLIGNGPSLKLDDLVLLRDEFTFAANKIFLVFDDIKWRPSYYFIEDFLVMKQNFRFIKNQKFSQMFFPFYFLENYPKIGNAIYFPLYQKRIDEEQKFSNTPFPTFYAGATVIYSMIQMAIYMGFREIYLIGIDFHFEVPKNISDDKVIIDEGKQNHFHKNYRNENEKWFMPNLERQEEAFSLALKYANENQIKIFNATRGGKLEVFPRIDFDKIVKKTS